MTDINDPLSEPLDAKRRARRRCAGKPARRSDAELLAFAELLFFAYRDFTRDPDAILQDFGFGRAHHRVLHFVTRHSGLRVADLLDVLKITKQSLGRVLKQLIDKGYIVQRAGSADRRERLLYPTDVRPRAGQAARRAAARPPRRSAEGRRPGGRYRRPPLPASDDQCRRTAQSLLHHVLIAGPVDSDGKAEVS